MLYSVLTVTARQIDLGPLAQALAAQELQHRAEWIVVDAHYPVKKNQLLELHRRHLYRWRLVYAPAPESWCRSNNLRFLASIRNESLRLAGDGAGPLRTICFPIDDDLVPVRADYLRTLGALAKKNKLPIPGIEYGPGVVKNHPSGNAAVPFSLDLALGVNGYDEVLDANWPGTSTYEDVDFCFRLKAHGLELIPSDLTLRQQEVLPSTDHVLKLGGIKCNHAIRVAASPLDYGGSGLNWETNDGPPSEAVQSVWDGCRYLDRDRCTFLARRCEIDLGVARFGHEKLGEFYATRPKFNLMAQWMKGGPDRQRATIGKPLYLDVAI